jgi:hypothetical protein
MYVQSQRRVSNGDIPVKAESRYNQKEYKIISSLSYSFSLNLFRFNSQYFRSESSCHFAGSSTMCSNAVIADQRSGSIAPYIYIMISH